MDNLTFLFDKTFRDQNGDIVIAQAPNLPIITWIVVSALRLLPIDTKTDAALSLLAFAVLFTWAWQEIFDGVNYFRRGLGLAVLLTITIPKFLLNQA